MAENEEAEEASSSPSSSSTSDTSGVSNHAEPIQEIEENAQMIPGEEHPYDFEGQTDMLWTLEHFFNIPQAVCEAMYHEGITTYTLLSYIDDESFEDLFKTLRKPGGPATPGDPTRTHPGTRVPILARNVLITIAYAVRHYNRIQRPFKASYLTPKFMAFVKDMRTGEKQRHDQDPPALPEPMKDETKIQQSVMDIKLYLRKCIGATGVPLSYVIRKRRTPDDSIKYRGIGTDAEMINQAPLHGPKYRIDNAVIWGVIATVIPPSAPFYSWIRTFEQVEDGRAAYKQIVARHMGGRAAKNIVEKAKHMLRTRFFDNKKPAFPFSHYVNIHKACHMDIDLYDHREILESEKVDYLLGGIQAPELDATCGLISLNPDGNFDTFDQAVSALQAEINRKEGHCIRQLN